jgi:hypothetical protein
VTIVAVSRHARSHREELKLEGLSERERTALETQKLAPTALGQTEALLERNPVRVPRWYLGGRTSPEAKDWPIHTDVHHPWFIVGPDDLLTPEA